MTMAGTEKQQETDQKTARDDGTPPPIANGQALVAPSSQPQGFSDRMGKWAFDHKETMNSTAGSLAYRNFARTLVAIVPYVFVNVGVQHFFKHTVNSGKSFGKLLTPVLKQPIIQSAAAIAFSFTTFRSTCKVWADNYDRIFKAKTQEDAAKAVKDLPGNIVKDYAKILPTEMAATGISAIILAAIRGGLKTHEPAGSQKASYPLEKDFPNDPTIRTKFPGDMKQLTGQLGNDYFANAAGYAAFFEVSDRLYSVFSKNHKNGVYHKGTLPGACNDDQEKQEAATPYDRLNGDTPARLLFRNVAAVFAATLPFIAVQRFANMKTGNYNNKKNSYMKDVGVGMASWEPSFAVFTAGIEGWQRGYDGLLKKLHDKYSAQEQDSAKTR